MEARIGIIGDFHIPGRAKVVSPRLLKVLSDFSPERILCTGDLTSLEVFKELEKISHTDAVLGERDFLDLPEEVLFELGGIKFCLLHGNQVKPAGNLTELENLAKYFGVNVLVSGHSHQVLVHRGTPAVLLNPGSATGVHLPGEASYNSNPSLILLEVGEGRTISARIVELVSARILERTVTLRI
jgi:putative phosphoesterase